MWTHRAGGSTSRRGRSGGLPPRSVCVLDSGPRRGLSTCYVLPTFGAAQLADIDFLAVSEWVARLDLERLGTGDGVVKAYQILAKVMRAAVQARRIPVSPCDGVELPKVERVEMRFLSPDEVATLAEAMDSRYSAAVLLGAYGGLRAGELFGLRAARVYLMRRSVDVAEIVTEVRGSLVFGPPKTRAGRRRVPVPPFVADALADQLSAGGHPDRWVFPVPEAAQCASCSWRQRFWLPATCAAGLEGLRIHDLRHTASLWLAAGVDPVDVARRAGHSSTVTVMDRYGHVSVERQDLVTEALEAMARGALPASPAPIRHLEP